MSRTSIWAHRGASAERPENTMSAFRRAVELGADGIELDVQRSADGRLVVIHDETVDRTTTGTGRLVELEWPEISRLRIRHQGEVLDEGLPLLEEVLELLAPTTMVLNVELKDGVEPYPGMDLQVDELVRRAGMAGRVVLSSFNHVQLAGTRTSGLGHPLGLLYAEPLWAVEEYATRFGAQAVHPPVETLAEPGLLERLHAAGLAVHVWTPNSREELARMMSLGVDAVITDEVALALDVRG